MHNTFDHTNKIIPKGHHECISECAIETFPLPPICQQARMVLRFFNESIFVALSIMIFGRCEVVKNVDICGYHNGRRLYLELGEQGVLYAKNISFINHSMGEQQTELRRHETNNSYHQCNLELVTCPSCAIVVTFKNLNLPHSCGDVSMVSDNPCRCDHVWISEPPYDDISGIPFCGLYTPIIYRSYTRTVSITFLYVQSLKNAFTIEYVSERNRVHLDGSHNAISKSNNSGTMGGILSSPFFPARYPRDLGLEYIITCPAEFPSCRIRVLFSDFQLATVSIIEFYDWNGQRLDVSSGARFRPPIIVSSGPSLLIRFYANGGTGLGYKAFYSYVIGDLHDDAAQPITDCGGYVENLGGAITMMDMVDRETKTYDCVWLIRPPKNVLHMKTHLYVKIITFADMVGNAELIIRQGPTSALLPLEILRQPTSQVHLSRLREYVAPISSGFHVSLRGTFGVTSRVAIAYAAFGYMDCFSSSDLLCHNHRCIASQLSCDGFDHCGDNSDEPPTCFRTWQEMPQDRKWHINKANYYFPKIDRYPDLKTATLVFVASSLGLIVLISALIILLYRMGARARQQRELQSRLQTISELLDGARIDEISVSDDPPVYEAPPGYDEVVKIGLESEVLDKKRKRNQRRGSITRSRSSPPHHRPINVIDRTHQSSQIAVSNNIQRIPESPPPPYITPPGTLPRNSIPSRHNILHISVPLSFRGNRSRRVWKRQSSFPGVNELTKIQLAATVESAILDVNGAKYNPVIKAETSSSQQQNPNRIGKKIIYNICKENVPGLEEQNIIKPYQQQYSACTCEGACGCANQSSAFESHESSCRKNTILRLLGTTKTMSPNSNSTTTAVTIVNPLLLSQKKLQTGSTSKYHSDGIGVSKLPVTSPDCSTDGLVDEFEIIPHTLCHKHTSPQILKYSFCDLESLYENIKRLDTFLAKRNITDKIIENNNQSGSLIFATPEHRGIRSERSNQRSLFNCVRGWSSSDDAFANQNN